MNQFLKTLIILAVIAGIAPAQPPSGAPFIAPGGIVPADSTTSTIQPGEWVSVFGSGLASSTVYWNGDFPTSLGGTSVTINDKPAYLSFVSPTQINLQAPNDSSTGTVTVSVKTASGTATGSVTLASVAPSFLLLDSTHVAGLILRPDGSGAYGGGGYDILGPTGNSLGYPTVAAKAGDTLELFAIGLGPTTPSISAGRPLFGSAPTSSPVDLLINNISVTPQFTGLTAAGLYQINVTLPIGLGAGDLQLAAIVGGAQTQAGVVISLQPGAGAVAIQSLTLSSNSVVSKGTVTGTVVLTAPAPSGGSAISFSANGPAAFVPPTMPVPAGATSITFRISAGTVFCSQAVDIAAFYGASIAAANLTVTPLANAPQSSTLAPGDVLTATFTSIANISNLLLFFNNDSLTVTGAPVILTELFNGTNLLGLVASSPLLYEGTYSYSSEFGSTFADLSSMQNGTIQGVINVTVSGGSISGFCISDFVLYDAESVSNGERPEHDLRNIRITLTSGSVPSS